MTDNEFNKGLQQAIQQHDPQLIEYLQNRDLVKPQLEYTPFEVVPQSQSDAAVATIVAVAKPLVALSAVGVVVASTVLVGVSVIGAMTAFVSAHAMYIGGGVFAVAAAVIGLSALNGGPSKADHASNTPPVGDEWEFYQKQEQGWRRRGG